MSTSSPRRVTWQSVMVRTVSPWAAAELPAAHRARKSWVPTNCCAAACMADCFGVSIDYLACGEKAAVVSVDGLTDEQINLMTELTRALRQQNKGRRGNPKSTPTPERQELVFKRVAQFLK